MENIYYMDFNVTGSERKRLVNAIRAFTGDDAKYCGAPSFAYEVGAFYVDRNGVVSFAQRDLADGLAEALVNQGFVSQVSNLGCEEDDDPEDENLGTEGLTISLPKDGFTEIALGNLRKLLDAKGALIQKALDADRLTFEVTEDRVSFPWWDRMPGADETQAYLSFVAALCAMAKEAKRVTGTEKDVESEKYAFRGFLLRLGFIGAESKGQRKLLLRNLTGSAAFPNQIKADSFLAAQKAKRDAAKAGEEVVVCE